MGNVLDTPRTGDVHSEDIDFLSKPSSTLFNDAYVNSVYENLPKFGGTNIPQTTVIANANFLA